MLIRPLAFSLTLSAFAFSCSEPPAPTASGNAFFRTKTAETGSGSCLGGESAVAPEGEQPEGPASNGAAPTIAGEKVRDGESGYKISCEMVDNGATIDFTVEMAAPKNFLSVMYPGKTNITARGTINKEASSGIGDVTFFIPGIGTVRQVTDTRCTFLASGGGLFIEYDGGDKQTQDTGDMWITFNCPQVIESSAGANNLCQSLGTINVSNCEGL